MVKKSIQANSQIKTTLLTATAANPAPSSSNQRGQPLRPVYTTQARTTLTPGSRHCAGRRLGFFDHTWSGMTKVNQAA